MRENSATPVIEVSPPTGAEAEQWTEHDVRDVYREIGFVETGADPLQWPRVAVTAEQRRDGRIGVIDVEVEAQAGLFPDQARQLAALLVAAADLADAWVGDTTLDLRRPWPTDLANNMAAIDTMLGRINGEVQS